MQFDEKMKGELYGCGVSLAGIAGTAPTVRFRI